MRPLQNTPMKKPLTGWLILLIVILSIGSIGSGGPMVVTLPETYQPYFSQFPSLQRAVTITQVVLSISIVLGVYTAWVLYRRKPGSLFFAQNCFLATVALRIAGGCSIPLLGGLPPDTTNQLIHGLFRSVIVSLGFTIAWYLYLSHSKKVHEIYAA
jgi:hypothetical protein